MPQGPDTPPSDERRFTPLPSLPDLPDIERAVLDRWHDGKIFRRSLERTAGGRPWTFYEGPPTANGMPGVHHVEARVFKDLFPRFKTMQGYHVPRQGGWDCHGLPVEVAVEQELGLSGKKDIEAYGIAEFNQRCRESVLRYVDAFEELTRRMGYWIDLSSAYRTMNPSYVESVWWSLKVIFDKGLLVRDFRISPYCPRCGTPLSDHEMGQPDVYQTVTDPSVTVRFPVVAAPDGSDQALTGADLLVWTTTPWTLVSNTAVAVHPDGGYVIARRTGGGDRVVVAEPLAETVLGDGWELIGHLSGADLLGARYRRPFDLVDIPDAHVVVAGTFVTTEEGTGLVHMAPAFGADDMDTGRAHGLPIVNPILPDGRFEESVPLVGGMFFKDADAPLVRALGDSGLLFRSEPHAHSYPHCWRCRTPLIYYALPSWYIRTTAVKEQLLAENERTNWQPPTIKHGRYGEWLRNNVDWALSRTRYWGTPLPLWECRDGHVTCVGSLSELSTLAGRDLSGLDPHRPYVDAVTVDCPRCGGPADRVPDVIDAWYDSGSMPFARYGAPLRGQADFERAYPAQFICEAIDQTRGWFYSLMTVGTIVFGRSSYENVVCLGLVVDSDGRKMSKHLGNVLEPLPLMERHGADALRWFFAATGSPWSTRRVGHGALDEIVRKVFLTYWNTVSFLVLYANAAAAQGDGWTPARLDAAPPPAGRPLLDRWILGESHGLVRDVTAALEAFDTATAGRRLAGFIDALSNWYVRRSRRRFWDGPGTQTGAAAFATLYECLETVTKLMAPIVPFLTDHVWAILRRVDSPESVHLCDWPVADHGLIDETLSTNMDLARRLVEMGRSARAGAAVKTRQPLARALAAAPGFGSLPTELRRLVAEELNVHVLEPLNAVDVDLVHDDVRPNFRTLGARFRDRTPAVAKAVASADPRWLAAELRSTGSVQLSVDGDTVTLDLDDVIVTQTPTEGWAVATSAGETVALEVSLTSALRREGLAREAIRQVQEARKNHGLEVTDRISLWWESTDAEMSTALTEHEATVAADVLATDYRCGRPPAVPDRASSEGASSEGADPVWAHTDGDLGFTFWFRRAPIR